MYNIEAFKKAQEMVTKYKSFVNGYVGSSMLTNTEYEEITLLRAQKLTKVIIDEIINTDVLNDECIYVESPSYVGFWKEVKSYVDDTI